MIMELYEELWEDFCSKNKVRLTFPDLDVDLETLTERSCYLLLKQIQEILKDDTLDDPECFMRIEKIVSLLEEHNISSGVRHDF